MLGCCITFLFLSSTHCMVGRSGSCYKWNFSVWQKPHCPAKILWGLGAPRQWSRRWGWKIDAHGNWQVFTLTEQSRSVTLALLRRFPLCSSRPGRTSCTWLTENTLSPAHLRVLGELLPVPLVSCCFAYHSSGPCWGHGWATCGLERATNELYRNGEHSEMSRGIHSTSSAALANHTWFYIPKANVNCLCWVDISVLLPTHSRCSSAP